jgi:hypothetical protein
VQLYENLVILGRRVASIGAHQNAVYWVTHASCVSRGEEAGEGEGPARAQVCSLHGFRQGVVGFGDAVDAESACGGAGWRVGEIEPNR